MFKELVKISDSSREEEFGPTRTYGIIRERVIELYKEGVTSFEHINNELHSLSDGLWNRYQCFKRGPSWGYDIKSRLEKGQVGIENYPFEYEKSFLQILCRAGVFKVSYIYIWEVKALLVESGHMEKEQAEKLDKLKGKDQLTAMQIFLDNVDFSSLFGSQIY